ncbi:MAG: IclR family transcriptional regulator [Dethiosulfatibacter sp.]|nr:IclR family transcriptional regulator [Dethiosulfatibacter sp.]
MNKSLSSTIDHAMEVLKVLSTTPYQYKISELEAKLNLGRTSISRILLTLEKNNMVIRNSETKKYKIGPFAYHLGNVYLENDNYESRVLDILAELSNRLKVSAGLAKRDGDEVISIFSVENYKPFKINYVPGTFFPINRGCYGKCLMAYYDREKAKKLINSQSFEKICENTITDHKELLKEYDRIKQQGFVVSVNETFPLAVGVGIPIASKDGTVRHCVAVSFIKGEHYMEKIEECKNVLMEYKEELSNLIP